MKCSSYFCSTIGRKQLVGLTGLALCGFVFTHAIGNMLILVSPDAYNKYSHALISNPLIYIAEAGLVGLFLLHIFTAIKLTLENRAARPEKYAVTDRGVKAGSEIAKYMWMQGVLIFIFLIYHLVTFKYGTYYSVTIDGVEMRDIHRLVVELFGNVYYTGFYIFIMVVLATHMSHGLSSAIQTFGFHHPKHLFKVKAISYLFSGVVALGFIVQPLYCFLVYKG